MRWNELGASLGPGVGQRNRQGAHIGGNIDDQHVFQGGAFGSFVRRRPGLASTGPVQAQSIMKQCGDDWKAAKENNTTNGMKWPEFLKQCRVQKEGAAAPAAAPVPLRLRLPRLSRRPRRKPTSQSRSRCKPLARLAPGNSPRKRKPGAAAAPPRWSGSTPRASPIPTITPAPAGTARRSRAPICARLTLAPLATMRRRARRNSRSRCSRVRGRAARSSRGPVLFASVALVAQRAPWEVTCARRNCQNAPSARTGCAAIFRRERREAANQRPERCRPIG